MLIRITITSKMGLSVNTKNWCSVWLVAAWFWLEGAGDCEVTLKNHTYTEETLASGLGLASTLAVDYRAHTVYFTFYNGSRYNAKLDLKNKAYTVIEELSGKCTFSVDQVRGHVYAGCGAEYGAPGGLYQLNNNTGRFELAGEAGRDIIFLYYHNEMLYYSFYTDFLLHTYTDGHGVPASAPALEVMGLVVDGRGDFIFYNSTGLYRRQREGEPVETHYERFDYWVYALAVDGNGDTYTCDTRDPRGIWRLQNHTPTATNLLDVKCTALTFDEDNNIIYADDSRHSIVRLVKC